MLDLTAWPLFLSYFTLLTLDWLYNKVTKKEEAYITYETNSWSQKMVQNIIL